MLVFFGNGLTELLLCVSLGLENVYEGNPSNQKKLCWFSLFNYAKNFYQMNIVYAWLHWKQSNGIFAACQPWSWKFCWREIWVSSYNYFLNYYLMNILKLADICSTLGWQQTCWAFSGCLPCQNWYDWWFRFESEFWKVLVCPNGTKQRHQVQTSRHTGS